MQEAFKDSLVDAVKAATEVLNDDDALAIIAICKNAANREIADVTERYIKERIEGGEHE